MKKNKDGLYETHKRIDLTGETLTGVGETKELAKADLKAKKAEYRAKPPFQVYGIIESPGYSVQQLKSGAKVWQVEVNRKAPLLMRPSLAKLLSGEEK
jgi:hypothetical protein